MATIPKIKTLTNTSVDVLNVIRENATQNYKDYVPEATPDADSIRAIGAIIMDYPALQNEFLSALVNRIGRVMITSKMYDNPWRMFKKGMLISIHKALTSLDSKNTQLSLYPCQIYIS